MAKYVVPSGDIIIKCEHCKTLYVPDGMQDKSSFYVEECPVCNCSSNSFNNRIPLWRYNLIKFWRGLKQ